MLLERRGSVVRVCFLVFSWEEGEAMLLLFRPVLLRRDTGHCSSGLMLGHVAGPIESSGYNCNCYNNNQKLRWRGGASPSPRTSRALHDNPSTFLGPGDSNTTK